MVKLAQEAIARKWGVIPENQVLDDITLQQYLDLYKKPLTDEAMEAINELSKVQQKKKCKKPIPAVKSAVMTKQKKRAKKEKGPQSLA